MFTERRASPVAHFVPAILKFPATFSLVPVLAVSILLLGCGTSDSQPAPPDYQATVQLLLPTAEPTEPPTPTVKPTDTVPPPTYTPIPTLTATARPTYTPRPSPTQVGAGERQPAITFQARLLDGTDLTLPDTFGTPTLLAFWAPW